MVLLSFLVEVDAPFQDVWDYFQKFENVKQWDPNIKKVQAVEKTPNQVGSIYNLTSQFFGRQSLLRYETTESQQTQDRGYRRFQGQNSNLKAKDQLTVVRQTPNTTRISWNVDMTLKGFLWAFTPVAYLGFKKLEKDGRQGCVKKCIQLFGNAREIQ